jgi:predicted RNase H-like HicB family nuclease
VPVSILRRPLLSRAFGVIESVALYCSQRKVRRGLTVKQTAVFQKVPEGYIGFVEELPGANTQARTLKEARERLSEAVELVLEANRTLAEQSIQGKEVIREPLIIAAE